jgi:hypothetical protein
VALPFVWRYETGEWPAGWIIAVLAIVALRILGAIVGALSEAGKPDYEKSGR